ncbi:MAG: glycosyltransferase [bacterium]
MPIDPPPTILLLVTTFDVGGAEQVVRHLGLGLARRDYRVLVACLQRRSGAIAHDLARGGVTLIDLEARGKADPVPWVRLLRILRAGRVDVVYTFNFHAHMVGRVASRLAGVPVVLSSQQTMDWETPLQEAANRLTARWCTRVVAVSDHVARYLRERVRIPEGKLRTIYNAVDTDHFRGRQRPERPAVGDALSVLGMVARLAPEKDHDTLLDALVLVRGRHPGARLLLAGDGPERRRLEERARTLGLATAVTFLGHVADVRQVFGELDLYVHSSRVEGLPVALLEAMASRLPVVAGRVGGTEEVVISGGTGLLVAPRDPAALAGAVSWMLEHPQDAVRLGGQGRRRVEELFSVPAMLESTDQMIRGLLKAPGGRGPDRRRPARSPSELPFSHQR